MISRRLSLLFLFCFGWLNENILVSLVIMIPGRSEIGNLSNICLKVIFKTIAPAVK